jgi:hypothetical protein
MPSTSNEQREPTIGPAAKKVSVFSQAKKRKGESAQFERTRLRIVRAGAQQGECTWIYKRLQQPKS